MRRALPCSCLLLASLAAVAEAPAPIVFFDVAGPEATRLPEFYAKLFGWSLLRADDARCRRRRRGGSNLLSAAKRSEMGRGPT
jgi:predicted enzyme related to lactoylglutathione lyase